MVLNKRRVNEDITSFIYGEFLYNRVKSEIKPVELCFIFKSILLRSIEIDFNKLYKDILVSFTSKLNDEGEATKLADKILDILNENLAKYKELYYYDNTNYAFSFYKCGDSYSEVQNHKLWKECPKCKLKPLIWIFDNGSYTSCGCGKNQYEHLTIQSESVNSKLKRAGSLQGNTESELMENWNHWCDTGEDLFNKEKERFKKEGVEIW